MKKSFIATVATLGILSTAALAYQVDCPNRANGFQGKQQMMQGQQMRGQMMQGQMMQGQQMQGQMMQRKGGMHHRGMQRGAGMRGMGMLAMLDLSVEQRHEISILRDEMRLEMKKMRGPNQSGSRMAGFITEDGFDKDAFFKQNSERHEKMMQLRAENMEKVFKILTKDQIKKLQTALK